MKDWYNLKDGLTEIAFARENLLQAKENLKINQDKYKADLAVISDLLDAQAPYQQASSDLTNVYANYHSKKTAYFFITEKLHEQYLIVPKNYIT